MYHSQTAQGIKRMYLVVLFKLTCLYPIQSLRYLDFSFQIHCIFSKPIPKQRHLPSKIPITVCQISAEKWTDKTKIVIKELPCWVFASPSYPKFPRCDAQKWQETLDLYKKQFYRKLRKFSKGKRTPQKLQKAWNIP